MNDLDRTGAYLPDGTRTPAADPSGAEQPQHIGRYRVEGILGQGGFGLVYLAHDDQLDRPVAIKVPHRNLVSRPEDAEFYLIEARTVANLDHANIVPVHDVGSTADYPCFIVSRFIEGSTLAEKINNARPSFGKSAELVATVAEALHYAHRSGLVHRDIKPGNILLDHAGKPFVVDFGLALSEENVGRGPTYAGTYAGTPAYMSPEQARGEGHRVDGRSDIFSLGVVFYELLVGRRPFRAGSIAEQLEQITSFEPRPPRQYDESVPKELDRICLKALSKRASERYSTAQDMADDLRHFLDEQSVNPQSGHVGKASGAPVVTPAVQPPSTSTASSRSGARSTWDHQPLKIVPKGLRSFDAHDADFFLELLPGPRDRDGLPDSIRFWKTFIEETDADNTFSVGLIYGPSGCGKSSLVKAGLLPRLSEDVLAVYVEATAEETEIRLLNGLRKRCAALSRKLDLKETLAALRQGQGIPATKKVVIVIDQFEQWLHAKKAIPGTELVRALRQCDGGRVQCIVMVRDDFWMAATRFMRELEVRLVEARNSAAVDLFDVDHARKVLAAIGRAFGKLPDGSELTKDQKEFLKKAVSDLAQEGKVISVRLALFADMMKGKAWTPATLKEMGGTEGVRVTFLEETFSAATAPPEHRYHQKAARGVLKALLPESGTDIKGHMRPYAELLEASGYGSRPRDFDELLHVLDSEIRLITPTDPEGVESTSPVATAQTHTPERYYQLTHDYLVPSLRDWLTRKQKETRRGRAELLLADRADVWNARPENRQLPSLLQWFQIKWLTAKKNWTPPQRKMMASAGRHHAGRGLIVALALALLGWGGYEMHGSLKAHGLRDRLLDANTADVPAIVADMSSYRRWLDPLLREAGKDAEFSKDARKQLHVSLALLPVDGAQKDYLYSRLLEAAPQDLGVLRDALAPYQNDLRDKLWEVAEQPANKKEQRLRAACALAKYDPDSKRWAQVKGDVVNNLVSVQPFYLERWMEALRPVRVALLDSLSMVYRDREAKRDPSERNVATSFLADYAAHMPLLLADLVLDGDDKQFTYLYPKFAAHGEAALALLREELGKQLEGSADAKGKEKLSHRQATAAVALLRMGRPAAVWPLLKHSPDPSVRSHLIHRLGPFGADAKDVNEQLLAEADVEIRRALILSLGEFSDEQCPPSERSALIKKLFTIYEADSDAGIHAAAEWLLREWGQGERIKAATDKLRTSEAQLRKLPRAKAGGALRWYVNGEGQTMVVIPGPVQFMMGSPPGEADRGSNETQHMVRISRTFAIGAKAVTVGEFRRMPTQENHPLAHKGPVLELLEYPVVQVSWYQAAAYCNWLSKELGIDPKQWCYETDQQGKVTRLRKDYLRLTGYRLPTEAEMEFATRAGATTSRFYGESEELLVKYGWIVPNSAGRIGAVGRLKPNDFGLFDMHGNAWCWCQEESHDYPRGDHGKVFDDKEFDELDVTEQQARQLRGACYTDHAPGVRAASRWGHVPGRQTNIISFRLARTINSQ